MNAITDPAALQPATSQAETFTLRRTGRKAVRFEGWQLIQAIGSDGSRPVWHDLNIYRTVNDCIVVELVVRQGQADQQEVTHVTTFPGLNEAAAWLEAYRAADDVPIPPGLGNGEVALPWAVLQAVQLRQSIDRMESDYRALITEVFAALDLTDPAEEQQSP